MQTSARRRRRAICSSAASCCAVLLLWLLAATLPARAAILFWTGDGAAVGGSGSWTAAGLNWTATTSPVVAGVWENGSEAVFIGSPGTVTLESPQTAAGLTFDANAYRLEASGSGSLSVASVAVTDLGFTATINAPLTGAGGFAKTGAGRLILGGGSAYTGTTEVRAGLLQIGASNAIPDASTLAVTRFAEADFAGNSDTVAGLGGEGTVTIGSVLTVAVAGDADVRFDGALAGTGDLLIDSPGLGAQWFTTSADTEADKLEKAYGGQTLVRRGTLLVDSTATPVATSGVEVLPGGRLILGTNDGQYTFGNDARTVVALAGGTLGQAADTAVLLANTLAVTSDSTIAIANTASPDPQDPAAEGILLAGPLIGSPGKTLTITASATAPGADTGRVVFASLAGNSFAGTVRPQLNAVARVDGVYDGLHVQLDGGRVDGSGFMKSIAGSGSVSPLGIGTGDGVLTAESLTVAADTWFEFGFTQVNGQPDWFYPDASLNDGLRLTGADPLPVALDVGNRVDLYLQVSELLEDDAFLGGFLTRTDTSALITNATFTTYVLGDGKGNDATHNGIGFYSLESFNSVKGIELEATVSMKLVSASFNGLSKEPAYLMQAEYAVPTGPILVHVASGTKTQAAAGHPTFSGSRGLTKTGDGGLVLDAANTHTGTTTVAAGSLTLSHANGLAASPIVVAGGHLEVAVESSAPSLSIENGTAALDAATRRVLGLQALSVAEDAGGGLLDLGRGRIDIASGGISPADLRADIIAGRNGGLWDGATGITSSVAAADTRFGVGYMIDDATGASSVAWAALGDANLDGLVNFDDILALFPNYNVPGTYTWQEGDFTYDSLVNFDDILALFPNYGAPDYLAGSLSGSGFSASGMGEGDDGLLSLFTDSSGGQSGGVTAVPEPSAAMLLATALTCAAAAATFRRRGRS
jgi:autotransporter-associated beta strand protein